MVCMGVEKARQEIDKIDETIVGLLNRRLELALKIGKEKKDSHEAIYDPAREEGVIERLVKLDSGIFPKDGIERIYREIFSVSRRAQQPIKVAYLGPETTFTHTAALRHFGEAAGMESLDSIEAVFNAVEKGEADLGVVPVENSIGGSVTYTYDMFVGSSLNIVAELAEEISHNLISKYRLQDIEKIYSHPMALAQCREWISKNLSHAEIIEVSSTAKSAEAAKLYLKSAGIGSELSATHYGLNVLARNIQDKADNVTRFLVIGRMQPKRSAKSKTSIMFTVKNEAGALFKGLEPLKKYGINMTKIESRPTRMKNWNYIFFVDVQGFTGDEKLSEALGEMKKNTGFLRVLGSYPEKATLE